MKTTLIIFLTSILIYSTSFAQTTNKFKLCVAGKTSGSITKKELLADSIIQSCPGDTLYKVISFKMTIIRKGKEPVLDIPFEGSVITYRARKLIAEYESGTKIYFEYIKATPLGGNDKSTRSLEPLSFTLSD